MLATRELDYPLPPGAVAMRPAEPRESARLMVVNRARGTVEHRTISDLPAWTSGTAPEVEADSVSPGSGSMDLAPEFANPIFRVVSRHRFEPPGDDEG